MARALVADDDPDVRDVLVRFLELGGHHAVAVRDGVEAVTRLRSGRYDVAVLDMEMPTMGGVEVLTALRVAPCVPTPVVILSGLANPSDRRRGMEAGATLYLTKPLSRAEFTAAIDHVLRASSSAPDQPTAARTPLTGA